MIGRHRGRFPQRGFGAVEIALFDRLRGLLQAADRSRRKAFDAAAGRSALSRRRRGRPGDGFVGCAARRFGLAFALRHQDRCSGPKAAARRRGAAIAARYRTAVRLP